MNSTSNPNLPAAPCRICGVAIKAVRGTADGLPMVTTEGAAPELAAAARRDHRYAVAAAQMARNGYSAGWTRTCDACSHVRSVADFLALFRPGHDLTEREVSMVRSKELPLAEFVFESVKDDATIKSRTGKAWRHVDDHARDRLDKEIDRVLRITRPSMSPDGACGLCGGQISTGWHYDPDRRVKWRDGSPAPICTPCWTVWDRAWPRSIEEVRSTAAKVATGVRDETFKPYFEMPDADGNGYEEPWNYSPRVEEIRSQVWFARPDLAPEDRRPEFEEKRRQRLAEIAAERAREVAGAMW